MLKIKGIFNGSIIKGNGQTITWYKDNLIVNTGYEFIANAMFNSDRPGALAYIALGDGKTETTPDMTTLEHELLRAPATYSWNPETRSVELTAQISSPEPIQISEAGIFNAAIDGLMFDRVTFSTKGLDETDLAKPLFKINFI